MEIKFSELLNEWLLSQKGTLKDGTYYSYKSRITSMIEPILGDKKISEMTSEDITNFTVELQEKGLSVKTVKLAITVVRNAVLYGIEHYEISDIMPNSLALPKQKTLEREPLSDEEQRRFIDYALSHNVRVNLCMLLVLLTGIKVGELCGLQWMDVDFKRNSIHIRQIVYRTSRPKAENHEPAIVVQECEEPREIPVPSSLMAELKNLHNRNAENYVFSGKETPYEPRIALTHLKKFLERSSVRNVSFNELRDNFVQNCINNGCDIMMTAKLLGTTSLNKLYDDFDWGEVSFDKSAEFMEIMGDRLIGLRNVQVKSQKRESDKFNEVQQVNATN